MHFRRLKVDVVEYVQLPVQSLPHSLSQANKASLVSQSFQERFVVEDFNINEVEHQHVGVPLRQAKLFVLSSLVSFAWRCLAAVAVQNLLQGAELIHQFIYQNKVLILLLLVTHVVDRHFVRALVVNNA